MANAQKLDFVFPRNGLVHLNRWGCQFSRLLAAEVCASVWVMLDRPRSEVEWEYWLPTPFASFPFTSPPVRRRVPPGSERALHTYCFFTAIIIKGRLLNFRFKIRLLALFLITTPITQGVVLISRLHLKENFIIYFQVFLIFVSWRISLRYRHSGALVL